MGKRTSYQQRVIKDYYQNREAIALQRVQELVTELYLSEGKKRQKHWQSIASHLQKLEVPQKEIDHLLDKDDPEQVAALIKRLWS